MEKARNIIFTLELIFGRMLTLKLVCLITLVFLVGVNSYSQTEPKKIFTSTYNSNAKDCCRLSVQYLIKKDYRKAELYLIKALKYDPLYIEARMRLANIYCETGKFELGEEQYLEVMESEPEYPYVYYNYANKSFNIKKYQKAIDNYEKFLEFDSLDNHYEKLALRNLELVKFRKNAYENPVPFNPENIGPGINSNLDEYWPVLTADDQTLYFTRKLYNPQQPHYKFNEDIYYSELDKNGEWSVAQPAPGNLNSPDNEGAILISPDGRYLLFTACQRKDSYGRCDIYYSKLVNGIWQEPVNMGQPINTPARETQSSISYDRKTLYFSSERAGTMGKHDIWKSELNENGKWRLPVNLGPNINTKGDEQSPFIHPDDQTLYFSSNYRVGMGGSDLFYAKKDINGEFMEARNLGYPINTKNNEYSLFVNASGKRAYFASESDSGYGKLDILSFDLYKEAQPNPVVYLKGVVYDNDTKEKLHSRFELIDIESGNLVHSSYSERGTGAFLVAVPSDKNYALNVSKKNYLFYSAHLPVKGLKSSSYKKDIYLHPIKVGEKIVLNNVFFNFDSYELLPESKAELKKVTDFLNDYPAIKVEISGHTDNKGNDDYNQTLSTNRAKSVFDYLIKMSGISSDRLTYKGYGETKPIDTNETEEGRQNNRRTEFEIIAN